MNKKEMKELLRKPADECSKEELNIRINWYHKAIERNCKIVMILSLCSSVLFIIAAIKK